MTGVSGRFFLGVDAAATSNIILLRFGLLKNCDGLNGNCLMGDDPKPLVLIGLKMVGLAPSKMNSISSSIRTVPVPLVLVLATLISCD